MDTMQDCVKITTPENGILQLTLNRPAQLNALNQAMLEQLLQVFREAKHNKTVKALLLTGEGKAFCAGADIKQLANLNGPSGYTFAKMGQEVFRELELLGKPSVALVNGFAFGGGCELAMSASLRIATPETIFSQPEIKLGVIPGFGGTQRLSRLIGKGRALDICLTGRKFKADEAYQWGLINEIVAGDKLLARGLSLLKELIQLSPVALQSILNTIHQGFDLSLDQAFEMEAIQFGLCCTTADKKEGVNAFLEKRTPVFSGE